MLPYDSLLLVIRYTNQKYESYHHDHPQNFAIRRFIGYKSFTKEKVLAFLGLSFIAGAQKYNQEPIFDLYDSKLLPHLKATMSRDWLLLLIKFCRFDDADTRNNHRDDRFGHMREGILWALQVSPVYASKTRAVQYQVLDFSWCWMPLLF